MERRWLLSTYVVNTLSDAANPGAGLLTLRQAVADANAHSGADSIAFDSKVFSSSASHTILLTQGQIAFSDTGGATTLNGPGAGVLTVNANHHSRIFKVSPGVTVSISGMTITNGVFDAPAGSSAAGGGILSQGSLKLTGVDVTNCSVTGTDNINSASISSAAALGGGISTSGPLTLNDCVISGNSATGGTIDSYAYQYTNNASGGGIYCGGTLTITGSSITSNTATAGAQDGEAPAGIGLAGGIFAVGSMTMTGSSVEGNTAVGGICGGAPSFEGAAYGGGIVTQATSSVTGSTFSNNEAQGQNANGGDQGGAASGGAIYSTGPLTIASSQFTANTVTGGGGDIDGNGVGGGASGGAIASTSSLTISGSTIQKNLASGGKENGDQLDQYGFGFGGGVYCTGQFSLQSSTVLANTAQGGVAGEYDYSEPGGTGAGGGLFLTSTAVVLNSSITGNLALGGPGSVNAYNRAGGDGGAGQGGGVLSQGGLTITNSTLSQNTAQGGPAGDGGYNSAAGGNGGTGEGSAAYITGSGQIRETTISGNATTGGALGHGTGGYADGVGGNAVAAVAIGSSPVVLTNSIVSGNTAADKFDLDISGSVAAGSDFNLIGTGGGLTNGKNGNKVGIINPQLLPLGWYGGPTQTMPPMPASPAIDAGSNSLIAAGVKTDQRGNPRISGKSVDIGSVEFGNVVITGTVFNDEDANGKRSGNEPGVAGFGIYLDLNHDGKPDAGDYSVVTNSAGQYSFTGLFAGGYTVDIAAQAQYRATTATSFTVNPASGSTDTVSSFGQTQDALISGTVVNATTHAPLTGWRVYLDLNNDGKWESTEASVVTTSNGSWSFNINTPGTYHVRIVPQGGHTLTSPSTGYFQFTVGKASARIGNVFDVK